MPGRNADEAWREFRDPIKRVVNAIDQNIRLVERAIGDGKHLLGSPPSGVSFGAAHCLVFTLELQAVESDDGQWRMTTLRYSYTMSAASSPNQPVIRWEWHPFSTKSPIRYPHLHLPPKTPFSTRHIPSGRVALEDIVLFGIDDFKVPVTYEGARTVVQEIGDRHKQHRSWN